MSRLLSLTVVLVFFIAVNTLNAAEVECDQQAFFCDSFETGDMSHTNSEGFHWEASGRTGVVSGDPAAVSSGRAAIRALPIEHKNWRAKEGRHSLIFDYPSGKNMAEQRFDLGTPHRQLWIRFWARVPENFSHNSHSPSNSKFFALWMDAYSLHGSGSTVIWEFWHNGNGGSNLTVHYNETGGPDTRHQQSTPFINTPADRGRWMQVVIHVQAATAAGAKDGTATLWRRWQDEADFTRFHHLEQMDFATPPGTDGWGGGYLLGWSNPGYLQATEWLVDSFTLSDHSLLVNDNPVNSPPMPPTNLTVNQQR